MLEGFAGFLCTKACSEKGASDFVERILSTQPLTMWQSY
jgi:hypothetical protein